MKWARGFASKIYVSVLVGAVWQGGRMVAWPHTAVLIGAAAAAIALALGAHLLVWWTRHLGDGIPFVEHAVRVVIWLMILTPTVLWMIRDWHIGIVGFAFLVFVAGTTWREQLERLWVWIQMEAITVVARVGPKPAPYVNPPRKAPSSR